MNPLGYITRIILVLAGASVSFAVVSFTSMGCRGMALLFLATIMIPVSMLAYEYCMNPK
jgi:hypothetical protein